MRILITGAGGQLGQSLQRMNSTHEVVPLARADLDVTAADACARSIVAHAPDAVIHCAALTDTARCEKEPALARQVNGIGTENVARACARASARLVAISTNEVFDGNASVPYPEDSVARPLNAYALSKLDGELLAAAAHRDTLIVRASWLYGEGYLNFNEKVLAAAREGRPLSFVTDESSAPTATDDLAAAIASLLTVEAPPGVYHLANAGEASRYEWACEVLMLAGIDATVTPVTTAELRAKGYAGPEKPPYSVLSNTRAAALGVRMRDWRVALADYFGRRAAAHG